MSLSGRTLAPSVMLLLSLSLSVSSGEVVKRSDDVPALQTVVQQQAQTIQQLQAELTALQQSLTSVSGRVHSVETEIQEGRQKQAAFHVKFSGPYNSPLDVGNHAILKFNSVITNVGKGFNPETGIFTAAFAGSYLFFLEATHVPDQTHSSQLAITKTGHTRLATTYGSPNASHVDNGYTSDTAQAATHLKAGEQVWVEHIYGGTVFRQSGFTTFTGALVQAD